MVFYLIIQRADSIKTDSGLKSVSFNRLKPSWFGCCFNRYRKSVNQLITARPPFNHHEINTSSSSSVSCSWPTWFDGFTGTLLIWLFSRLIFIDWDWDLCWWGLADDTDALEKEPLGVDHFLDPLMFDAPSWLLLTTDVLREIFEDCLEGKGLDQSIRISRNNKPLRST